MMKNIMMKKPTKSGYGNSVYSFYMSKKTCPFVLKIFSGTEILTSTKGYNSVSNVQKIVLYNPNLDVINVNVYTKFG